MDGSANGANTAAQRAERFEDEKRRIIDSCFSKQDENGDKLESYITHIRIIEDAAYPSTPPPPNSSRDVKKQRIIIVAVRKSGRVRLHKARENVNGSFSIGKTWPLDDLTGVESFSGMVPRSIEEEQRKEWAGGNGFIVALGKAYYWEADTQKEKQFFIASLVKIYTKYTGGKAPELSGFDAKEREQLTGITSRPQALTPTNPPSSQPLTTPQGYPQNSSRGSGRPAPFQDGTQRPQQSQDRLPRSQPSEQQRPQPVGNANPSLKPQPSRSQIQPQREAPPTNSMDNNGVKPQASQSSLGRVSGYNRSQESFSQRDTDTLPYGSRGPPNGPGSTSGRVPDSNGLPPSLRPGSSSSTRVAAEVPPPVPAPLALPPERRRPPISDVSDGGRSRGMSNDSMIPAPLASPNAQRSNMSTPASNADGPTVAFPNGNKPAQNPAAENNRELTPAPSDISPIPSPQPPITPAESPAESPVDERPGLGPMIKKKLSRPDVASTFRRMAATANAVNAFKPRAGGAAERIREQASKTSDGPDGITGVVPAPSLVRGFSTDSKRTETPDLPVPEMVAAPKSAASVADTIPEVKITKPQQRPQSSAGPENAVVSEEAASANIVRQGETKRPKATDEMTAKYLASLNLDVSILDGRGADFSAMMDHYGWVGEGLRTRNIDEMKSDIERDLNQAQLGGWLGRIEEDEQKRTALLSAIDRTLEEVEEYEGLLALAMVELSTAAEDIQYINAQSQGLQVQAANQKLLQAELQSLLQTISISTLDLQSLREASLESSRGLEDIESSLVLLYKAMVTIDPALGVSGPRASEDGSVKAAGLGNSEIGSMRVLQEKKETYRQESVLFLRRLKPFLQVKFGAAIDKTRQALEREPPGSLSRRAGKAKIDPNNHALARALLWRYSPMMLFSREIDRDNWNDFMKTYEVITKPVYQLELIDTWKAWRSTARKVTGDEGDILFTSQIEKQAEGLATTARKLTVKRSQTLAKSLRSPLGDSSRTNVNKIQDGRLNAYETISNYLDEAVPLIMTEQNFIVDFFHVSSLEVQDFPDVVAAISPDYRNGGDVRKSKPMDPNRDMAKRVAQFMEEMYSFFSGELSGMVEWALSMDPLQGVGILAALERKLIEVEETNQEYLARTLQKLHGRLLGLFRKFLDEQVRAIEDTKVKIKKRKGVISFIRIFPSFSTALETMLALADDLEIREIVNHAYGQLNKTMFESLKVIARENPSATSTGTSMGDPEDKEALNYQILLIENMYHYVEEVDSRRNPVLEEWKEKASMELDEHLSLYVGAVVRRPLGKLLDQLDKIENEIQNLPFGATQSSIGSKPSFSKSIFKAKLATNDSKEVRRGIETLKKRVEKHFGDGEDQNSTLVAKVLSACEKYYEDVEERVEKVSREVYEGETGIEWTRGDVAGAFKR